MDTPEKRTIRTLASKKDLWEYNILQNKPYIKYELSELWNDFEKIDGCLVAASPKLKDNLAEIKDRSRSSMKTEIVAVDMAAKFLIDNGIEPDFIVCCESSKEATRILDFDCDIPLICDVVTNPEIVKNWKGEKLFFVTNNSCIDLDNNKELFWQRHQKLSGVTTMLKMGGNVGSAGLSYLLSVRNCNRIYLYGHEFCWKKGAEMYCGGIQSELANKRIITEQQAGTLYETTDMNNDTVYTNMSLQTFCDWYKDIMKMYPGVIVNHTNAGLLYTKES